jgi:hypothetical protein
MTGRLEFLVGFEESALAARQNGGSHTFTRGYEGACGSF